MKPIVHKTFSCALLILSGVSVTFAQVQKPTIVMKPIGRASNPAVFVDLQPVANKKLTDSFGTLENNLLTPLDPGIYQLDKVEFKVDEKLIHLGSTLEKAFPACVAIPIGKQAASLEVLHATVNGGFQDESHPTHVPEGTAVGAFEFLYADGSKASVDIVYGKNVRDWWSWDHGKDTKHAKLAWVGVNPDCNQYDLHLRLFHTSIGNPHPDKPIKSVNYRSNMKTPAAPFCVAISLGK